MNEITKMVIVTTVICALSATLLGSLKEGLSERIIQQEDYFVRGPTINMLLENCPNNPLQDKVIYSIQGEQINLYPWIEEGKVRKIALEQPGQGGYGGDVVVMVAVDLESDKISGVHITQHKETPGVGTRAMEPAYLSKYLKIPIMNEIKLSKDGGQIDAVSGATRSSIAIADGVNQAAKLISGNKEAIIKTVLDSKGA